MSKRKRIMAIGIENQGVAGKGEEKNKNNMIIFVWPVQKFV